MSIGSFSGTPPGIISVSNRRLLHFFIFGAGGAGAGNGGYSGGNGAVLAFDAFLEKEDIVYMYKGSGGAAGGTSNQAIGGGGGAASFVYVDPRGTRLGPDPSGYSVNNNLLFAVAGGGGGGGTESGGYGGSAGTVNTTTGATNAASGGGGTNPGGGGTFTAPGSGGTYTIEGVGDFNGSNGPNAKLGSQAFGGFGGAGYVNGTVNGGGQNTGVDEATVVGSVENGHGAVGYQDGGAGGGGGYYGGGGSTYDGSGVNVGGAGGGSSYVLGAMSHLRAHNLLSDTAGGFDETDVNGFDLTAVSSLAGNPGRGGNAGAVGVAGENGVDGYIVILNENGDLAAETSGAASGWSYTVV